MGHYQYRSYVAPNLSDPAPVFSLVEDVAGLGEQAVIKVVIRSATNAVATGDNLFIRFLAARILAEELQEDAPGGAHLSLGLDAWPDLDPAVVILPATRIH